MKNPKYLHKHTESLRKKKEIMRLFELKLTHKKIGEEVGVGRQYVSKIIAIKRLQMEHAANIKKNMIDYAKSLKEAMPNAVQVEGNPTFRHVSFIVEEWHTYEAARIVLSVFSKWIDWYLIWEFDYELELFCHFSDLDQERNAVEFFLALPIDMTKYDLREYKLPVHVHNVEEIA
jgi:hypothetical protein